MSTEEETRPIICRVWTGARRHEMKTGSIGGQRIPTSTDAQMVATPLTAGLLIATRGYWDFLPLVAQIVLFAAAPAAVWLALRFWHPDDRQPHTYLVAVGSYALRPRQGRCRGKAVHLRGGRRAASPFFFSGSDPCTATSPEI